MPPSAIDRLLANDRELQPVVAKLREILALSGRCSAFLPPELSRAVRASNLRDGRLVLLAANAAAAAKLRLLGPSLVEFLSQQGTKVNSVSVRVQPRAVNKTAPAAPRPGVLPDAGFAALSALYKGLADSPARRALERLLKHEVRGRKRRAAQTRVRPAG